MKQWDVNWGAFRKEVVYAKNSVELASGVDKLIAYANDLIAVGEAVYAKDLVANIYIDMNSMLTMWFLDKGVSKEEKDSAVRALKHYLIEVEANDELAKAEEEIASIKTSQMGRIAKATADGELVTYWGNDLCTDIDFSIRRGCCFTTSNPSKINQFRTKEPQQYSYYMEKIEAEHPGLTKEERFSRITVKIVSQVARKMRPIFEATGGKFGVSFTQVNPYAWDDSQAMIDEVRFWFSEFQKELGMERPNVVFKMPATPAAKEAAKVLLEDKRIRITFTSNFAVGQHTPFYDIIDDRDPNCFLVIVDCHLRKYCKEELGALGIDNLDYYCQQAYWAVYQKCYQTLIDRHSKAMINGAGMREDVGIRLCLSNTKSNPVTVTMTPTLAQKFDSEERSLDIIWDKPIPEEDMAVLNKSETFRQSYYAEEFPWNNVNTYKPYAFMMEGFYEAAQGCFDAMND